MKSVRFLLVGCGAIGERHARLAAERGQLVAVCDVDEKRLKAFTKTYNCYGYTSLSDMLHYERADALLVCTPNGLHAEHSIAGLKAGLHVLCEKPMALNTGDCRKMIRAAHTHKRHLYIVKQNRFNPPVAALKNLVEKERLGTVYSLQINCFWNRDAGYYRKAAWRGTRKLDGGTLFTQFSHFVDLLYWLFGDVGVVNGFTANRGHRAVIETEDTGVFSFRTRTGIPGTLHYPTNTRRKNMEGSLTVFAEKGTIKIGGAYLNTVEYQEPVLIRPSTLMPGGEENTYKGYGGSMNNRERVYKDFLRGLSGHQAHYSSGEEALHSVRIIEKFYHAASRR